MKIRQWLGYNEDASQYLLRPGELRVLNNLQSRRPGMLITRPGIKKIYGRYDEETIFGIYRRATILGSPSDFIWLQKVLVERELSADEIGQSVYPFKHVWQVKRVLDDSARVIDTLEIAPNGTTINNFCLAEDRHGRIFLFYGHGVEPRIYKPDLLSNELFPMGLKPPLSKPKIKPSGKGFFIEQVDVGLGGGGYNSPPNLTVSGGEPIRAAQLKAIVQRGNVVGVDIIDGGAGYKEPPEITAGMEDVGSGFRAIGNRNTATKKLVGFDQTTGGVITFVTGASAPSTTETYGTKDGTENQQIGYRVPANNLSTTVTEWIRYYTGDNDTLNMGAGVAVKVNYTAGVRVGNLASVTQWRRSDGGYHNRGNAVTVTAVDHAASTLTFNGSLTAGAVLDNATFYYEINIQNTAGTDSTKRAGIQVADVSGMKVGESVQFTPDFNKCVPNAANTLPLGSNSGTGTYFNVNLGSLNATNPEIIEVDEVNNVIYLNKTFVIGKGSGFFTDGVVNVNANSGITTTVTPHTVDTTNSETEYVPAIYNESRRRFFASVPTSSTSQGGGGAFATLEFSPLPLGHAVNTSSQNAKAVRDTGLNKHFNIVGGQGGSWVTQSTLTEYLYGEYWSGSDFDRPRSAENARYGGLQASGSSFVHGFSGTAGGRKADVYWPDYSKLSVWFNTGVRSGSLSQWTRADVQVQTDGGTSRYIEFELKPTRNAKRVKNTRGSVNSTEYDDDEQLPEAVAPTIRINLVECPSSWVVEGNECVPTANKETGRHGAGNRLPWWSASSGVPRPIVDLPRNGTTGEIETTSFAVTGAGNGWAKNTEFAFRIYQANAYAQHYDYNTATTEATKKIAHGRYSTNDRYVEFSVKADVADANTPHGPPHTLIQPAVMGIVGDGYEVSDQATLELRKRPVRNSAPGSITTGHTLTWTATQMGTQAGPANSINYIDIHSKGLNYKSKPEIQVSNEGKGYGLKVDPVLKNGQIDKVIIVDSGQGYDQSPHLTTTARPAKLTPVMRPAMRGMYQCAYRFVDRSDQIIKTITAERGESTTILTVSDTDDLETGMILESPKLPENSKIVSIIKDQVEISEEMTLPESYSVFWQTGTAVTNTLGTTILGTSTSTSNFFIYSGTKLYSANNEYALEMEVTGDLVLYKKRTFINGFNSSDGSVRYGTAYDIKLWSFAESYGYVPVAGANAALGNDGQLYIIPSDWPASPLLSGNGVPIPSDQMPATLELTDAGNLEIRSGRVVADISVRDTKEVTAYSDLSPFTEVEAGPVAERSHCSQMEWTLEGVEPPKRCDHIELWRTSSDQSLVFYRCEAFGKVENGEIEIIGTDTLTDEELFDPDRPNYAALPVVLPNGSVNAFRFGKPRKDMAIAVAFQDRLFMAVSTSGKDVNTLFYSEFDEFESVPDVNELPIQSNQKSNDVLTALVPFGSMLLAMQHTHTYSVTYNTDPSLDASIQMMSHRGTLHQRCWDIHENILYSADESGIYAMSRNGEVTDISLPVRDYFVGELIDFNKRETFFLQSDPRTHILRFFCSTKEQATETPAMALCYDIQAQSWWTESYPNSMTAACTGRPDRQRINTIIMGSVNGNLYEYEGDGDEPNACLTGTSVSKGGSGYRESPTVTVTNCKGAKAQGVVSQGQLVDVVIQNAGWDADYGINILTESGDPIGGHDGKYIQGAEYAPIRLEIGPPDPGGIQATAEADWEVMPEIKRFATVTADQNFVRIDPSKVDNIEPDYHTHINSEGGFLLEIEQTYKGHLYNSAVDDEGNIIIGSTRVAGPPGSHYASPSNADMYKDVNGLSWAYHSASGTWVAGGILGDDWGIEADTTHRTLRTQPPAVEVGMEAIGDFIPLNSFVSSIDRNNVYLKHPDGTDVVLLNGQTRSEITLPEITVPNVTTSTQLLNVAAKLALPALNTVGQVDDQGNAVPYTITVDDASGIKINSIISGSTGVPAVEEQRLTDEALSTNKITVVDASQILIGSIVSGNPGIPANTSVTGIGSNNDQGVYNPNIVTLSNTVDIPESRTTGSEGTDPTGGASGGPQSENYNVNPGVPQDVRLYFTFHTQVAAIDGNKLTTTRPINIPTSSFNDIYLRFKIVGTCSATRFHVGEIQAIESGESVTGTGVPTGTILQDTLAHTHFADPSHDVSSTNIIFLTCPPIIGTTLDDDGNEVPTSTPDHVDATPGASLTFSFQATPVQTDAGTDSAWLELGGTRILVRFVKPSKTSVPFRMQTGHMQVVNEDIAKKGDQLIDRSFSLIYTPTYGNKEVSLLERYNGQSEPRSNEMRRDRGGPGAFVHRQDSASTVLNMNRESSSLGFATGVAKAKFASSANADMTGTDQHVQIELFGQPSRASQWDRTNFFLEDTTVSPPLPCVLHQVIVEGVVEE